MNLAREMAVEQFDNELHQYMKQVCPFLEALSVHEPIRRIVEQVILRQFDLLEYKEATKVLLYESLRYQSLFMN